MKRVPRMQHDKDAKLDYGWDWSLWLTSGETISTYVVSGPSGFTVETPNLQGSIVTAFVTATVSGLLTCHVVTNFGREDDRSIFLLVQDR